MFGHVWFRLRSHPHIKSAVDCWNSELTVCLSACSNNILIKLMAVESLVLAPFFLVSVVDSHVCRYWRLLSIGAGYNIWSLCHAQAHTADGLVFRLLGHL